MINDKEQVEIYKDCAEEISKWLKRHEDYEPVLEEEFADIPTETSDKELQPHLVYALRKYNKAAKLVEYHGYTGLDAFREARSDLKFFEAGIRNLS